MQPKPMADTSRPLFPSVLFFISLSCLRYSPGLRVVDLLHPFHRATVQRFLDGDVAHPRRGGRAMPMLQAGRKPYHVARTDFFDGSALALHPAETGRDNQS